MAKDFFKDSCFSNGLLIWRVERVAEFAKGSVAKEEVEISRISHDRTWWQGDVGRMMAADVSYPVLIVEHDDGKWSVADGLNRMEKSIQAGASSLWAYVIKEKDILHLGTPVADDVVCCTYSGVNIYKKKL